MSRVRHSFGLARDSRSPVSTRVVTLSRDLCPIRLPPFHLESLLSDGESCRPQSRQPDTTPILKRLFRPVTGPVRFRFLANLPAKAPVHSQGISRKSLFLDNLPISCLFAAACMRNSTYPHENKDLRGRGEGGTSTGVQTGCKPDKTDRHRERRLDWAHLCSRSSSSAPARCNHRWRGEGLEKNR